MCVRARAGGRANSTPLKRLCGLEVGDGRAANNSDGEGCALGLVLVVKQLHVAQGDVHELVEAVECTGEDLLGGRGDADLAAQIGTHFVGVFQVVGHLREWTRGIEMRGEKRVRKGDERYARRREAEGAPRGEPGKCRGRELGEIHGKAAR